MGCPCKGGPRGLVPLQWQVKLTQGEERGLFDRAPLSPHCKQLVWVHLETEGTSVEVSIGGGGLGLWTRIRDGLLFGMMRPWMVTDQIKLRATPSNVATNTATVTVTAGVEYDA